MKIINPSVQLMRCYDPSADLRFLEQCGRVCYQSEDAITETSAPEFIENIKKRGHLSVLEHVSVTFKIVCDRGVSHELVRHRLASYSQESTRYCVAGDMQLYTTNPHNRPTVRDLYHNKTRSKNGAWKRMLLRQYNEDTHLLEYAPVKDVWFTGVKPCLKIKTRLGYELICTPDHEVLTDLTGVYTKAGALYIGDHIAVNGTKELYKNKAWLYDQSIVQDKTFVQIAKEFGFSVSVLKKWARVFGIPKKGTGYFNIGRVPWNKGIQDCRQIEALRKYHHKKGDSSCILKPDTKVYRKRKKVFCEICGATKDLIVHHIDKDRLNNYTDNLLTVCESCHLRVHSKNLITCYLDEIVAIEKVGDVDVYDIEMGSDWHNFVANGVIVHNCNYSKGKFGKEITVVRPSFYENGCSFLETAWRRACEAAEKSYFLLLELGGSPQEARSVLPNSLKTTVVMTANLREWRHFCELRTAPAAHPDMQCIAELILMRLNDLYPIVFSDLM